MSIEAQCPPEPGCSRVIRFGISDHACLISDIYRFHHFREWLRWQKQVPNTSRIRPTQTMIPIQMDGSWKMPVLVNFTARPIASPASIHNAHISI
jgi:hypothetical protein